MGVSECECFYRVFDEYSVVQSVSMHGAAYGLGLGLGLRLLKDNDEDITIFQGNRYPQLRSAKLPLHSESDDLKGGNNAGVRSTRLDRRGFLEGLLACIPICGKAIVVQSQNNSCHTQT